VIFAFADQHAGAPTISAARKKANDPNDWTSVAKHIKNKETLEFVKKAERELR